MAVPSRPVQSVATTIAACIALAAPLIAADATGSTGLHSPVTGSWKGVALRALVEQVADAADVPVVIDRRVDGATPLSIDADGVPAGELLRRMASEAGYGVAEVRAGVRIAPRDVVPMIEAGDREAARAEATAPAGLRRRLARNDSLEWEAASRPRDIVKSLARSSGILVEDLDRLPHDHLPAAHYRTMPLGDRLSLVLGHYGLTFATAGADSIRVVAIPAASVASAASDTPGPSATARPDRGSRATTGPSRSRVKRPPPGTPEERFSLEAAAPVSELLATLASRFGLKLVIDEPSLMAKAVDPGEIVRIKVADVPRDGVFDAVLEPLGLTWTIEDGSLIVR